MHRSRGVDIVVVVRIIVSCSIERRCIVPAERFSFRFQSQRITTTVFGTVYSTRPPRVQYGDSSECVVWRTVVIDFTYCTGTVLDSELSATTLVECLRLKYAAVVDDRRATRLDYVGS